MPQQAVSHYVLIGLTAVEASMNNEWVINCSVRYKGAQTANSHISQQSPSLMKRR
jgi:hypothetical protein